MAVSTIIYNKAINDNEPKKKSREDWRKAKELEEARKAGTAPAAVDEEGKDINPHIPQYIATAPWYFGSKVPTLKHQRPQLEKEKTFAKIDEWYHRGVTQAPVNKKYRKGACANCGAMTHSKKDCFERPRKVGAKFTNSNIAPDEFVQPELPHDYDGKRDRWNGYDPAEHSSIVREFHKVEEAKRQLKAERLKQGGTDRLGDGDDMDDVDEENEEEQKKEEQEEENVDEDKYVDEVDMPGTKVDSKQRITVRNLRIREDIAKYLRNLDPDSAYYDPKTRSMRDNPYKNTPREGKEVDYAGENFIRFTGDTRKHSSSQIFAWEAYERGVDVHLLAEPTKLELLQHEYDKVKEEFKGSVRNQVLERYGGKEHLCPAPLDILPSQSELYVEYSRQGHVIKGEVKPKVCSRYEEDVYINNHQSVWGSYWKDGQWGYKCCQSYVKNSYCVGDKGRLAEPKIILHKDESAEDNKKHKRPKNKENEIEDLELEKRRKIQQAFLRYEIQEEVADRMLATDIRKQSYNSKYDIQPPTEEDMEVYMLKRQREDDPLSSFK